MFLLILHRTRSFKKNLLRHFSSTSSMTAQHACKVLIVGGGTGGCAVAAKFSRKLKKNQLIIVEPNAFHYYQPLFTLIGGGVYRIDEARRTMASVLPEKSILLKNKVTEFQPKSNSVVLNNGDVVQYDFMLVATGLRTCYEKIPGLLDGLSMSGGVCSNYSPEYVGRTFEVLKSFKKGNAVFTYPNSPVKCPGAPQKICYLTDDYLRKHGNRGNATVIYNTSLPEIFAVKKYADALLKICKDRDIQVNFRSNLVKIDPDRNQAVFENLDKPGEKTTVEYSMLHVTPPMSTPDELRTCRELTNEAGFVDVDKWSLQSVKYSNVFAIGDCSSCPNSKTAAAIAAQCQVVYKNMLAAMKGKTLPNAYHGYASCPLITGYDKCILAEFDYNLNPLETFPVSQEKELYFMYIMKKLFMPTLYWNFMMNGFWNGPALMRNILHLKRF